MTQALDILTEMTALAMEGLILEIDSAAIMDDDGPRPGSLDADVEDYCTAQITLIHRAVAFIGIPEADASPYRAGGSWPTWLIDLITRRRSL